MRSRKRTTIEIEKIYTDGLEEWTSMRTEKGNTADCATERRKKERAGGLASRPSDLTHSTYVTHPTYAALKGPRHIGLRSVRT